jgi:acyl-CoA synthetase (NDP forming)
MVLMMDELHLDFLFNPRSVAVTGVSVDPTKLNPGCGYVKSLIDSGFKGKIYPISPSGGEVYGLKIYPSIKNIPDKVDYVIGAMPAKYASQLVSDCADKGVRAIQFFSSGFSEIEDKEGARLESEIVERARKNNLRILGPNCMGIYAPGTGLSFVPDYPDQRAFPKQSGPLGFISQSGGNSVYCIREAAARQVYFSKAISYGNASDLNETDFLGYFTDDPDTRVIAVYIEGVKDGAGFTRALKRAARLKPVIIYKAGVTEAGARASASHTGAIAGSEKIWESLLRQAGAIQVHSIEEMIDIVLLFLRVSPPVSRNTVIIGAGGGASVGAADECFKAGLNLPLLSAQVRQKLIDINGTEAGRFYKNPVDTWDLEIFQESIKVVADCAQVDLLIAHVAIDMWPLSNKKRIVKPLITAIISSKRIVSKPMVVVLHTQVTDSGKQLASEEQAKLCEAGFAVYPSFSRAAGAINKYIQYHQWHQKNDY